MVVIQPLSTRLIKPNFCFHLSNRRNTTVTVSLETRNLFSVELHLLLTQVASRNFKKLKSLFELYIAYWKIPVIIFWIQFFNCEARAGFFVDLVLKWSERLKLFSFKFLISCRRHILPQLQYDTLFGRYRFFASNLTGNSLVRQWIFR